MRPHVRPRQAPGSSPNERPRVGQESRVAARLDSGRAEPVVAIDDVSVPGRLHDVSLRQGPGALALIGANGAGKSSLLHVLAGRLRPRRGRVRILGVGPRRPGAAALRAYVPQRIDVPVHLRGWEVLAAAASARMQGPDAVHVAAERMGLGEVLDLRIARLSGGMRQRLALAAGLIGAPPLWLLDEPASALDAGGLARLAAWVDDHLAAGGTVVTSAHRPEEVDAFAHEALLMRGGRVLGRWPVPELFVLESVSTGRPVEVPGGGGVRRRPGPRLKAVLEGDDAD